MQQQDAGSVPSSWPAAPHLLQDGGGACGALRPRTEASCCGPGQGTWEGALQDTAPGGAVGRAVFCTRSDLTP